MTRAFLITLVLALVIAAAPASSRASITIDGWDSDSLSSPSGTVSVNVDGLSTRTATVSNSTTLESVAVTLATPSLGNFASALSGDQLGLDHLSPSDSVLFFDGQSGQAEAFTLQFDQSVTITTLHFENLDWDPFAGDYIYEYVLVSIGGTLTHTLFSDSAVTSHPGYTGATGEIQASAGDDFNGLSWNIPAATLVEFRFGADPLSFSTQQGYRLDDVGFTVSAVPEASAFWLGGAVCSLAAVWQWRRQRRPAEAKV